VTGRRSYNQQCPIANGLDVLGERWTLLIVRQLVGGPSRYSDLRAQLPGIATNLLAQRLDELEQAGVVERTELPPPVARTVYSLSDDGWRFVLPILGAIARFGVTTLRFDSDKARSPLNGFLVGVLLGFEHARAVGVEASYRVQIDGRNFDFTVTEGRLAAARGEPAVTLSASASDLVTARLGKTATQRTAALRRLRFHGDDGEIRTMQWLLGLTSERAEVSTRR
jgi:DNA-binding HxlR family transcriptional regulator